MTYHSASGKILTVKAATGRLEKGRDTMNELNAVEGRDGVGQSIIDELDAHECFPTTNSGGAGTWTLEGFGAEDEEFVLESDPLDGWDSVD